MLVPQISRRGVLAAVALVALLPSCGGGDDDRAADTAPNIVQPGAPGQGSRTISADELSEFEAPPFVKADVSFMQGMIHHHAQALRMTALVAKRSAGTGLPLLAERMDISQESEIEQMKRWLRQRRQRVPAVGSSHHHVHGSTEALMPGMLREDELRRLERARGRAFDTLFLRFMIRHHQGALTMVRRLYDSGGGAEPEADAFARHVEADQRVEIARMQELLAESRQARP